PKASVNRNRIRGISGNQSQSPALFQHEAGGNLFTVDRYSKLNLVARLCRQAVCRDAPLPFCAGQDIEVAGLGDRLLAGCGQGEFGYLGVAGTGVACLQLESAIILILCFPGKLMCCMTGSWCNKNWQAMSGDKVEAGSTVFRWCWKFG